MSQEGDTKAPCSSKSFRPQSHPPAQSLRPQGEAGNSGSSKGTMIPVTIFIYLQIIKFLFSLEPFQITPVNTDSSFWSLGESSHHLIILICWSYKAPVPCPISDNYLLDEETEVGKLRDLFAIGLFTTFRTEISSSVWNPNLFSPQD